MSENQKPPLPSHILAADTAAPFGFTFGNSHTQSQWSDFRSMTWPQLVEVLTSHVPGPKEGSCIVPALFNGNRRHKDDAARIDVAFLDSDSGMLLSEIEAAVIRNGWEAVISSTHSHMSTQTKVARANWDRFFGTHLNATAEQFLVEDKGYTARVAAGAEPTRSTAEFVYIDHAPCPKFRVAIPLERPWLANNYGSQSEANLAWKTRIEALAHALGLPHDQACTDTSRLFYLPRRPPHGATPETAVVVGAHCDIFALPSPEAHAPLFESAPNRPHVHHEAFDETEYTDPIHGEVIDLVAWARAFGSRFLIAKALRSRRPQVFTGHIAENRVHIDCPNAKAHTNAGRDGATYVANADSSATKGFVIHCRHGHCTDKDRLFFVRSMLQQGWLTSEDLTDAAYLTAAKEPPPEEPTIDGFDLHEDGLAQAFTKKHAENLRYCHHTGAWFRWTGQRWREDETRIAFEWARQVCRALALEAPPGRKATLAKAATASAVERFAQSDLALSVTSSIWDSDPFLLGTPGGTVDLRTGQVRDACPEDFITKQTAISPALVAHTPIWDAFLAQATGCDKELIRFLKQWCGYTLTGDTREHALLFIFGPGGNGKSVFLNTCAAILSDYCKNAAMDSFTATKNEKHSTDLAMLKSARMVCASETEEGKAWAETRIKSLTGGDTISARFMRQDFFEYRPQFKLIIIGNHRPVLHNVDDAARRRFNVVPFEYKPDKPNQNLEEELKKEWPAILRWMIDGCLDWQQNGLMRPLVVRDATSDYFSEQDIMQQWIEDCCEVAKTNLTTGSALFGSWKKYAANRGEQAGSSKGFSLAMQRRQFKAIKDVPPIRGRGFAGIRVCLDPDASSHDPRQGADQ